MPGYGTSMARNNRTAAGRRSRILRTLGSKKGGLPDSAYCKPWGQGAIANLGPWGPGS